MDVAVASLNDLTWPVKIPRVYLTGYLQRARTMPGEHGVAHVMT
jgi:hypothetical protein